MAKSKFCLTGVKFLGYVVDHGPLKTNLDKFSAITDLPPPKTVCPVRRFFEDFASHATPLTKLLKSGKTFDWTAKAQTAFENLKAKLLFATVLASLNSIPSSFNMMSVKLALAAFPCS